MNIPYTLKQRKQIKIVLILLAVIVAVAAITTTVLAFVQVDVAFTTHDISITYGDKLDLSGFTISTKNVYGNVKVLAAEESDIDYKPESIGTQIATVKYGGKKQTFQLTVVSRQLDTPNISIADGVVIWNEIKGAKQYKVDIDDASYTVNVNRYDLSAFPKIGTLAVRVTAQPDDNDERYIASNISQSVTITKLNAISNLQYKNGQFVWDAVEGAVGYSVTINGAVALVTDNSYTFNGFKTGSNECSIFPMGDDYHWSGDKVSLTIEKLATAKDISYDWTSARITWDYEESDAVFSVFVNDQKVTETYNHYHTYTFIPSESYKVAIVASNDTALPSDRETKILSVIMLGQPSLNLTESSIDWNAVPKAEQYEICVDSDVRIQTSCTLSISELSAGEHTVKVRSYSEGGMKISSDYSTVTSTKLADVSGLSFGKTYSQFTWNKVADALKYSLSINGTNYLVDENSYTYEDSFVEGINRVVVNAVPKSSSYIIGKSASLNLYKLQKVRNVVFTGRYLTWEDDNEGCLYRVEVGGELYTTSEKQLELSLVQRTDIKITAYSAAANVLQSELYAGSFTTLTLATPTVAVSPHVNYKDTYNITITPVPNAKQYNVTVYVYSDNNTYTTRTFTLDESKVENGKITRAISVSSGTSKIVVEVVAVEDTESYNDSAIAKTTYVINN